MKIITNNQSRPILYWNDLTEEEQDQLDDGWEDGEFFRYKGEIYSIADFTFTKTPEWDGILAETFFSGILVRLTDDGVIVGRCYT